MQLVRASDFWLLPMSLSLAASRMISNMSLWRIVNTIVRLQYAFSLKYCGASVNVEGGGVLRSDLCKLYLIAFALTAYQHWGALYFLHLL